MFFLRNRPNFHSDTPKPNSSLEIADDTPVFFLPSLFRISELFSGPETSYEDEAWAPEQQQIRLFSKRRGIAEE